MIDGREIGHSEHIAQWSHLLGKLGLVTNMLPQAALAVADIAILEEGFLRPTNDGRHKYTGQTEIIIGLQHKFDRRQQILHHQRLQQTQPVDTRDGHFTLMQLRNQHRCHLAPAAQKEHDIAGFKGAAFAH